MPTSAWYQGESLKRLLQGAAVGAVATLAIGFGWGGWMLGSSAKTLADSTASSAGMLILVERVGALQQEDAALKEFNAEALVIKAKDQIIAAN